MLTVARKRIVRYLAEELVAKRTLADGVCDQPPTRQRVQKGVGAPFCAASFDIQLTDAIQTLCEEGGAEFPRTVERLLSKPV